MCFMLFRWIFEIVMNQQRILFLHMSCCHGKSIIIATRSFPTTVDNFILTVTHSTDALRVSARLIRPFLPIIRVSVFGICIQATWTVSRASKARFIVGIAKCPDEPPRLRVTLRTGYFSRYFRVRILRYALCFWQMSRVRLYTTTHFASPIYVTLNV